jgi:DHA1 family bicyclomycin/chloramphenicol resistance-like MFS transporter
VRLFVVLGAVSAIGPAAMDVYLPGLPELADDFAAGPSAAQVTLTTYVLGLALGQLLAGPLSDIHGRRRPLVVGMAVFTVATFACSLAPSLWALAALRLVQGATAAVGVAIGRAVVRDLYVGAAGARYLSRLILVIGLAPIVAPVVGGQLLRFTSWRGVFVALSLVGLALTAVSARLLPETLPREHRRAASLGGTARTFALLLRDRRFVGFVLVVGLGGGAMLGYIAGSSFVLQEVYGASPQLYGVLFAANAVFLVVGAQINAHLLSTRSPHALLRLGVAMMVVAGLSLLAIVSLPDPGLAAVMAPLMLLMLSWSFIQANALALALVDHPDMAGTAAALLGVGQYAFGALMAPLVGLGEEGTAVPMAAVITICGLGAAVALEGLASSAPRRVVARSET